MNIQQITQKMRKMSLTKHAVLYIVRTLVQSPYNTNTLGSYKNDVVILFSDFPLTPATFFVSREMFYTQKVNVNVAF